jgi:hypothetical protein
MFSRSEVRTVAAIKIIVFYIDDLLSRYTVYIPDHCFNGKVDQNFGPTSGPSKFSVNPE